MQQKLIYLLEDDADILQLLQMLLSARGYQVKGFTTVKSFIEQVSQFSPDLFILDINLPDGNGLDVSIDLSSAVSTRHIPVLLMSANAYYKEQYLQAGAQGFLGKPFDIADLLATVRRFI